MTKHGKIRGIINAILQYNMEIMLLLKGALMNSSITDGAKEFKIFNS